jgi:hypothetical protein
MGGLLRRRPCAWSAETPAALVTAISEPMRPAPCRSTPLTPTRRSPPRPSRTPVAAAAGRMSGSRWAVDGLVVSRRKGEITRLRARQGARRRAAALPYRTLGSALPHWRLRGPSPVASLATSCLWKPLGPAGSPTTRSPTPRRPVPPGSGGTQQALTISLKCLLGHGRSRSDLDALLASAAELAERAFVIGSEQAFSKPTWQSAFTALAAQHKIPAVSSNPGFITAGGLMSYRKS